MSNRFALSLLLLPMLASAADSDQHRQHEQLCPTVLASNSHGQSVAVWQHRFEDGTFDLVMTSDSATPRDAVRTDGTQVLLTRLSFKGSKEPVCHFPAFTIKPGGAWGWHAAWSSSHKGGVYYARVDGQMWVSSPPKKINNLVADLLELSESDGLLILRYASKQNSGASLSVVTSGDEGRNWDIPPI